jgi:radical SAM protein (TIGR01212 family)
MTCPNRDGTKGKRGCVYCDASGSGSGELAKGSSIKQQIEAGIAWAKSRFKATKFIAYYQSFTNTYAPIDKLRSIYDEGLSHPDIVGLAIGTRPDCVPDEVLDLIHAYSDSKLVWLELGLQSANTNTLRRINRGHTVADFVDAVSRAKLRRINVCAHIIVGLPGETNEDFTETADLLAALRIEGVKIHSLYIPVGSQLAADYAEGLVSLLSREEYVQSVCDFLEHIPSQTVIQRLTGETSRDRLLAPDWALDKRVTIEMIQSELERRNTNQGSKCRFTKRCHCD